MLTSTSYRLTRQRTLSLLDKLEDTPTNAISIYLPPSLITSEIEKTIAVLPGIQQVSPVIAAKAARSTTGIALFWGDRYRYLLVPPFPLKDKLISQGYDSAIFRALLEQNIVMALMLIRLGSYAIGVVRDEKLLSSKVGTGLVHARHRQGGSSQHRFERHRDKQIEYFFTRVCNHAREHIEPYLGDLNYIRYGGERFTIQEFIKQCQFLKKLEKRRLPAVLDIREPRQATLEAAISMAWSCDVLQWQQKDTS
jgi:hypothetical protein